MLKLSVAEVNVSGRKGLKIQQSYNQGHRLSMSSFISVGGRSLGLKVNRGELKS